LDCASTGMAADSAKAASKAGSKRLFVFIIVSLKIAHQ
jgi:hypothetical protein